MELKKSDNSGRGCKRFKVHFPARILTYTSTRADNMAGIKAYPCARMAQSIYISLREESLCNLTESAQYLAKTLQRFDYLDVQSQIPSDMQLQMQ